jgi:hypothetical protein
MYLGVGMPVFSWTALRAQFGGQFHVVEDLAVLHHGDLAVGADRKGWWPPPMSMIDRRRLPIAHPALRLVPDAFVVRTAMREALPMAARTSEATRRGRGDPSSRRCRTWFRRPAGAPGRACAPSEGSETTT